MNAQKKTGALPFPKLEFGSSGAILLWAGPKGQPLLQIFDDNAVIIESEKGQINLSTIIRNRYGSVVAEIIKNEWKVNPSHSFDRNYSRDAIDVKDDTGDIVLQVRMLKDRVQLQAKFYDSTGQGIGFGMGHGTDGTLGGMLEITGSRHPRLTLHITPLFRYPSDKYLGKYAGRK